MKLYVAGPMTGHADYNYPAFHAAAERLRALGHAVMCPAEAFGGDQGLPYRDYARQDLHYLLQAEGVVLLDGWGASRGASTEVVVGLWLGLPFFFLHDAGLQALEPDHPLTPWLEAHRVRK